MDEYRARHNLSKDVRIFICIDENGNYKHFINAMRERGWHHNSIKDSPVFDLKYSRLTSDVTDKNLTDGYGYKIYDYQIANHYGGAGHLTSKVGLTNSMRSPTKDYYESGMV